VNWILHSKPWITEEDKLAVNAVLTSGLLGSGDVTKEFEEKFADWVGASNPGVAVSSGAASVFLALKTLGVKTGDEVILPTYVCWTVLEAVISCGAQPVLCDVGQNWIVEPENVKGLITKKTKGIIVPHMYGIFADVKRFKVFGIPVIEDCAQAVGDKLIDKIEGDIAIFSFQPTKCLTTGEGGMVVTQDPILASKAKELRDGPENSGKERVFAPMSNMNAALGLSQLKRYSVFLERRRKLAGKYLTNLSAIDQNLINFDAKASSMFFRMPLKLKGGLEKYQPLFAEQKIHIRKGVDKLLHRLMGQADEKFPVATDLFNSTISLPIYPALTDEELERCLQSQDLFIRREKVS
jgi:UDP-4-amino-4-deoxy-L-arabinose-oxoglutarate aminotransferase